MMFSPALFRATVQRGAPGAGDYTPVAVDGRAYLELARNERFPVSAARSPWKVTIESGDTDNKTVAVKSIPATDPMPFWNFLVDPAFDAV
jgi:hypothetical protein